MHAGELADSIAADLFTAGGRKADRLVLTIDATGQNLGGWCQRAVADRIRAAFRNQHTHQEATMARKTATAKKQAPRRKETELQRNVRIGNALAKMLGDMVGQVADLALDNHTLSKQLEEAREKIAALEASNGGTD